MSHHGNERQQTKREKGFVFDSTNQDEGAWLQLNDYKIQKNDFTGSTSGLLSVRGEMSATFDPAAEEGGGGAMGTKQV